VERNTQRIETLALVWISPTVRPVSTTRCVATLFRPRCFRLFNADLLVATCAAVGNSLNSVYVDCHHGLAAIGCGDVLRGGKGAGTGSKKDVDAAACAIGGDEVELAIVVEVCEYRTFGAHGGGAQSGWIPKACTGVQVDRGVVATLIGDHEIRLPITVEIFGQNHARLHAGGNRVSSREIAGSVSIVDVDLAGGDKSYCQIEFAIAVPVIHREVPRCRSGVERGHRRKSQGSALVREQIRAHGGLGIGIGDDDGGRPAGHRLGRCGAGDRG
jgi:hypothetical protein